MTVPSVAVSATELPKGSHAAAFYADRVEAAEQAAAFLAGAPEGQSARFWVPSDAAAQVYVEAAQMIAPSRVDSIEVLPTEQVEPTEGKLRPVAPVRAFLTEHPEGVTAAGGTISYYWNRESVPEHLEYEQWFNREIADGAGDASRFLCPYDLRTVPAELAPRVMRELGASHSHVVLSATEEPGAHLLELFLFESTELIPSSLTDTLAWAIRDELVQIDPASHTFDLTRKGEHVVREWSKGCSVDW
jgi:hypothetical protein